MSLPLLKYVKGWFRNNRVEPEHWDEVTTKTGAWASEIGNDIKQLGLDVGGSAYDFNGNGRAALSSNLNGRVTTLEASSLVGASNIGIDISVSSTVELTAADQTDLSASNLGQVVLNYTNTAGYMKKYNLSSNLSVVLTGAAFGFSEDLTDYPLWILLIDTGSAIVLGVSPKGGVESAASANCKTLVADCTARTHILCSSAVSSASNCIGFGWIKTNFDYTGGASEKLWTIQSSQGDVNIGPAPTYLEVSGIRF